MSINLPGLPFIVDALAASLDKLLRKQDEWRARFPNLPDPPAEFRDEVLPKLVEATGDPAYAELLLARAWTGIQNKEAGSNRHHGSLA